MRWMKKAYSAWFVTSWLFLILIALREKKTKTWKIWVRMNNLCLFLNQPRENWHSLNNVWLCVFDNRVCIRSNNAFLHSIARILAWASYCAKIDFPKTACQRTLVSLAREPASYGKRPPRVAVGRWGIFFNLVYAASVNLIIPIMKRNCWTKRSIRFKVYNRLQWWEIYLLN